MATFKEKVYQVARKIPKGKAATYGQIARLAGNQKAARAVGMFMKMNPYAPSVPCHRVVAANGHLTGYSAPGGVSKKMKMLKKEGVMLIGKRVNLACSGWKK